jgi:hypothetical protein
MAIAGTTVAKFIATRLTTVDFILRHPCSAFITVAPIPIVQIYIRTVRVIGMQDIGDQGEKVKESALVQGGVNGRGPVTFAQSIGTDVRVGDFFITGRRMRILGVNEITTVGVVPVQILDLKLDLEWSQVHVRQFHGRRLHGKISLLKVKGNRIELFLELPEFLVEDP